MGPEADPTGTNDTNEARARVEELEAALDQAIDYLGRLPRHPETTRMKAALARVREGSDVAGDTSRRAFVGASFTRLGVPLLRAELHGTDLYVSVDTPSRSDGVLLEALRAGPHVVHLRSLAPGEAWTEIEVERFHR